MYGIYYGYKLNCFSKIDEENYAEDAYSSKFENKLIPQTNQNILNQDEKNEDIMIQDQSQSIISKFLSLLKEKKNNFKFLNLQNEIDICCIGGRFIQSRVDFLVSQANEKGININIISKCEDRFTSAVNGLIKEKYVKKI